MGVICCIDVGGTFTDCLVLDESGELKEYKVLSTPQDPSLAVMNSLEKAAASRGERFQVFTKGIDRIIHGTTLATNALLTGKGAKVGLITTKGFRDVLEIRRGYKNIRTTMFNVFIPPYQPLVPRHRRLGVEERIMYSGKVLVPLNEKETEEAAQKLKEQNVEAVAVCFLHSYGNSENEVKALETCKKVFNGVYLTASHEVLPVGGEYERFSTTVVGAYVGPLLSSYLDNLESRLNKAGCKANFLLVQADGLVQSIAESKRKAVYMVESGPAAGPSAAIYCGLQTGFKDLISIDMGGTSFDVCLIREGDIPTTHESWKGDERVAIKMVDVRTAGAGGGSIAWIDSLGLMRVGPQSAGADPGPACYQRGGTEATVTDADVLLGYIAADNFLRGEMKLDSDLSQKAISALGKKLGTDSMATAQAIFHTVNSFMADQITEISTKRGYDVRDFAIVSGGGAGPVHAAGLADILEIPVVLVPGFPASFSAFGMFTSEVGREYVRAYISMASRADLSAINSIYRELESEALQAFASFQIKPEQVKLSRLMELRYAGQYHQVEIANIPQAVLEAKDLDGILERFHRRHEELYTFNMPFRAVEILALRVKASTPNPPIEMSKIEEGGADPGPAFKGTRECFFSDQGRFVKTSVYEGPRLRAGNEIPGPALIEEGTTVVVIPSTFRCVVDRSKNYILRRNS